MTIDDAIKCAIERVEESRDMYACLLETSYQYQMKHKEEMDNYKQCAEEHEQLSEWLNELKKYKDAEQQGLLPKFHLGDEFWTVRFSGVTKEKIVMLQQKKDGTWKYRFPNTCDYEESDYGKYFFDTKDEAEKFWGERYGSDK